MGYMEPLLPERLQNKKTKLTIKRSNKAVAYLRVSDDSQIEGESLGVQKQRIEAYAQQNDIEIVEWFKDEGKSGKDVHHRPGFKEMLLYCMKNKGKIGYAIFYKLQRASRDSLTYNTDVKAVFIACGVAIRSATEHIDDTPSGRFIEGVLVLNGQLDNEVKGVIVSDNMESVARQGWWQNGLLVGYNLKRVRIAPKKKRTTLTRNKHSSVIAELFELFASGNFTQADLVRIAKEKGVKNFNGNDIDDNAIHGILTQPAYAGYICNKFTKYEYHEGQHLKEALVSLETFEKVQKLLKSNPLRRNGKIKVSNELFPLSKLIKCFNCNGIYYYSSPRTGNGGHSPRYHCSRIECKGKVPSIKAEKANELFGQLLTNIEPSKGTLRLYKEILNRQAIMQLDNINKRVTGLRNAISSIDKERATALRRWNLEEISSEDKDEIIATLATDKLEKIDQLQKLVELQSLKQAQIEYAMNFMNNAYQLWVDADLDMKQRFQKMIFPDGVIFNSKTMEFGTSNISPLYRFVPTQKQHITNKEPKLVRQAG